MLQVVSPHPSHASSRPSDAYRASDRNPHSVSPITSCECPKLKPPNSPKPLPASSSASSSAQPAPTSPKNPPATSAPTPIATAPSSASSKNPSTSTAFERTRAYSGLYHVLHGAISPTSGIAASDLKIKELLQRLQADNPNQTVSEVIVATNTNLDGEATAMYLQRAIGPAGIKVTRLARGLPSGTDIEYADDATLAHSLESRSEIRD